MTEEEKKAKLAELKEKAAAKKALKAIQDREEAKANEVYTEPGLPFLGADPFLQADADFHCL